MRRHCHLALAALALLTLPLAAAAQDQAGDGRIDTARVFSDWKAWETSFQELEAAVTRFSALRERPLESPEDLLRALRARDEVRERAAQVECYLRLRLDLDRLDTEAREHQRSIDALTERWETRAIVWLRPRLLELGWTRVEAWLGESEELGRYRFSLQRMFRRAARSLPEPEERLLHLGDLLGRQTERVYSALNISQPPPAQVRLASGELLEITPARSRSMLWELADPGDRRLAQQAWLEALGGRAEAHAALLGGVVQGRRLVAEARGFDSPLAAALDGDRIPVSQVQHLLTAAREGVEPLRRYHRLRRRTFRLDRYGTADRFLPLGPATPPIPYAQAREWIVDSAAPLGTEVQDLLRRAFEEGWIDAYERPGKRTLAGVTPVCGPHPWVLASFDGTLTSLFALAHELGHAVHHELAHRAQPSLYSHPSTLTAETVASVHEAMLVRYLLARATTEEERLRVADFAVQDLLRLFYRTVLDADFELELHQGRAAFTAEAVGALYLDRLRAYYGDTLELEPWDRHGWLTTPHFFTAPLYMLRYGLSYAAAAALADGLTGDRAAGARERYLELLRAGGSDEPMTLLARAGAPLEAPETIRSVPLRLQRLVDLLEAALGELEEAPREESPDSQTGEPGALIPGR